MKNPVVIKRNKYGIVVILNKEMSFEELLEAVKDKFKEAGNFFKGAQMAVAFEGRVLSFQEEEQLVDVISENSMLDIACIIDQNQEREEMFKQTIEEKMSQIDMSAGDGGQFYRGTLRSGQSLEAESSIYNTW